MLFLETSEELPTAQYVGEVLMCLGERGLLQRFSALLMGRPRGWVFGTPDDPEFRAAYVDAQREAVLSAFAEYSPDVPLVLDVDLGHTDPHLVDPARRRRADRPGRAASRPLLTGTLLRTARDSTSSHTEA